MAKIAIIGNMNNNGFSIMRYLRDLGQDAYLLLYSNSASGGNSHFTIEADSWVPEKWRPFIKVLSIPSSVWALFKLNLFPIDLLYKRKLRKQLSEFDVFYW